MSQDNKQGSNTSATAFEGVATETTTATATHSTDAPTTATVAAVAPATPTSPMQTWLSPGEAAFQRIRHLSDPIPESEQMQINVEATMVSTTALGSAPRIKAMRPDFVAQVSNYDMTLFDVYEDSALAFEYTDVKVRATKQERKKFTARAEALTAVRDQLYEYVEGIAGYGLVNKAALSEVKKEFGYKPMLRDVSTLLEVVGQNWQQIGGKAPFTLEEMSKIADEVLSLRTALGVQEQSPDGPRQEIIQRRQVYTLFRRSVAEARKVAILLHGEDAVGSIVPSFFNAPGKGKPDDELDTDKDAVDSPIVGATTSAASNTATQRPSGFVINNPENLPITSPFIEEDDHQKVG